MTQIRFLEARDEAQWRPLWHGYLEYYKAEVDDAVTAATFQRLLKREAQFGFVAENDGALVGITNCVVHPSTWALNGYCYLEDLYVAETARGTGAGRALIEAVYAQADKRGCGRVYWNTEDGNKTARRLYDKLAEVTDFVQYRRKVELVREK